MPTSAQSRFCCDVMLFSENCGKSSVVQENVKFSYLYELPMKQPTSYQPVSLIKQRYILWQSFVYKNDPFSPRRPPNVSNKFGIQNIQIYTCIA